MFEVALRNGKRFAADGVSSILDAARVGGLVLEHSCRTGRCGSCKAQQLSGDTLLLRAEESLGLDDAASGYILTCCRAPASDIAIDVDDLGRLAAIATGVHPCRIAAISMVSNTIVKITLRLPPAAPLAYLPGQYVNVIVGGIKRSYSIANAPRENGTIDLLIRKVVGGRLSEYWFDRAVVNDLLRIEGPLGTFVMHDDQVRHIVFLATGTGIAPVIAFVEDLQQRGRMPGSTARIYWGNRLPDDFFWQPDDFTPLDRLLSGQGSDWTGRRGHIQDAMTEDFASVADCAVYACGNPLMIEDARHRLFAAGLQQRRFFSDSFVSSD